MKSSCINHPAQESLIIIRKWQVEFCEGNTCAAALLSLYEYWHNIKLEMAEINRKTNDIAEMHGDSRSQHESLLQFHSEDDLEKKIMINKRDKIRESIYYLEKRGVIKVINNPNPRYKFDKTRHFLFNPEVCNEWIQKRIKLPTKGIPVMVSENQVQQLEKPLQQLEKPLQQWEKPPAIPKITPEITKEITHTDNKGVCDSNESVQYRRKTIERLQEFWSLYPKKEKYGMLERVWCDLFFDPSLSVEAGEKLYKHIMEGLENQMSILLTKEERYRPSPKNWLLDKQWMDETGKGKEYFDQEKELIEEVKRGLERIESLEHE